MSDDKILSILKANEELKKYIENAIDSAVSKINTAAQDIKSEAKSFSYSHAQVVKDTESTSKSVLSSIDKRQAEFNEGLKNAVNMQKLYIIGGVIIGLFIFCGIGFKMWANSFSSDIEKEKAYISTLLEQRTQLQNEVAELQKTQANLGTFGATQAKLKDGRVGLAFPAGYNRIELQSGELFIYKPK